MQCKYKKNFQFKSLSINPGKTVIWAIACWTGEKVILASIHRKSLVVLLRERAVFLWEENKKHILLDVLFVSGGAGGI